MTALAALLIAEGFLAVQYTPRTVALRGCSDCAGEADDVCEVREGAQMKKLDEYARDRWPAKGRLKLLRPSADPDCAVQHRGAVELAAMRLARAAPSDALLAKVQPGPVVRGWPRSPAKRTPDVARAALDRSTVRLALLCWPADDGWPAPAQPGRDARAALTPGNACEWWLLPMKPGGEPDLTAASFPLGASFAFGDARWPRAFDVRAPLDEAAFLGEPAAAVAAMPPEEAVLSGCARAAANTPATLDRFEQWEARVRGASAGASIDRAAGTLDAAAWSGHCQELDVLRTVVEKQLGCKLRQQGDCAPARGRSP